AQSLDRTADRAKEQAGRPSRRAAAALEARQEREHERESARVHQQRDPRECAVGRAADGGGGCGRAHGYVKTARVVGGLGSPTNSAFCDTLLFMLMPPRHL